MKRATVPQILARNMTIIIVTNSKHPRMIFDSRNFMCTVSKSGTVLNISPPHVITSGARRCNFSLHVFSWYAS